MQRVPHSAQKRHVFLANVPCRMRPAPVGPSLRPPPREPTRSLWHGLGPRHLFLGDGAPADTRHVLGTGEGRLAALTQEKTVELGGVRPSPQGRPVEGPRAVRPVCLSHRGTGSQARLCSPNSRCLFLPESSPCGDEVTSFSLSGIPGLWPRTRDSVAPWGCRASCLPSTLSDRLDSGVFPGSKTPCPRDG